MGDSVAAVVVRVILKATLVVVFFLSAFVAAIFDLARKS